MMLLGGRLNLQMQLYKVRQRMEAVGKGAGLEGVV